MFVNIRFSDVSLFVHQYDLRIYSIITVILLQNIQQLQCSKLLINKDIQTKPINTSYIHVLYSPQESWGKLMWE